MKPALLRMLPMLAAAGLAAIPSAALACASCGCTLSADWQALSFSSSPGIKLDLRYDYLEQNQLRAGTGAISGAAASRIVNQDGPQEVEQFTRNNYLTVGIDVGINKAWGINLQVPSIGRRHATLGTRSDGSTAGADGGQYASDHTRIGDVKLVARYQGLSAQRNVGLLLGMKLPTGSHTLSGVSTDAGAPGPVAVDRGLQPGTGTSDLIVGAYTVGMLDRDWDYYAEAVLQGAVNARDSYRPGKGVNLNLGLRYLGFAAITPQLQMNSRRVAPDSGENADTVSTGGTLVYLSPGIVMSLDKHASVYAFLQIPAYQNVNGVQLTPRLTASAGARYAF
ncbi:MAG: TonB-dependent receptor [Pseudomonadota bacterium]